MIQLSNLFKKNSAAQLLGGGGLTIIFTVVRGVPFLGVSFVMQKINFRCHFVKITNRHSSSLGGMVTLYKNITLQGIHFDQIFYTWLKFWIFVTILGYVLNGP